MLSKEAIAKIFRDKVTNNKQLSLQVVDSNSDLSNIDTTQKITLSDGNWLYGFKLLNTLRAVAKDKLRQFDVVVVDIVFNPRTSLGTITSLSIEESGISSMIGSPQNVENYDNMQRIHNARSGRVGPVEADDDCVEITNLTPYDHDWKVKGRVIRKTNRRFFTKRDGTEGSVFNIHILDENNDRIQGVFFSETAEQFHERVAMGNVYYFKGGDIKKVRNPKFNTTGNDLELIFNRTTRITEAPDNGTIPRFFYKFVPLNKIESLENNSTVDVLALVHKVEAVEELTLRSGEKRNKQNIVLVDGTGVLCNLTLWGDQIVEASKLNENEIVGFNELKVREFRGKQLAFQFNSKIILDNLRDLPIYRKLMSERNRGVTVTKNISSAQFQKYICKKIRQVDQECKAVLYDNYESKETKLFYNVYAHITFVKERISYPSCHNDNCKKKVIKNFSEQYECARCNQTFDNPKCKVHLTRR